MAATTTQSTSHRELTAAELLEHTIMQAISQVEAANLGAEAVDPGLAFDIGCHLSGARTALGVALNHLREHMKAQQTQEKARAVGA